MYSFCRPIPIPHFWRYLAPSLSLSLFSSLLLGITAAAVKLPEGRMPHRAAPLCQMAMMLFLVNLTVDSTRNYIAIPTRCKIGGTIILELSPSSKNPICLGDFSSAAALFLLSSGKLQLAIRIVIGQPWVDFGPAVGRRWARTFGPSRIVGPLFVVFLLSSC